VVLVVDVEPDEHVFPPDSPSPWDAFPLLVATLSGMRAQLEDLTGNPVAFAWSLRMDPQVATSYGSPTYVVDRFGDLIDKLLAAGDELGIHPHAWRWQERDSEWVSDHVSQAWLDECLDMCVEAYRSAFGKPPSHHRFGAGHMNSAIMRRVDHHGIPLDLTLEPGAPSIPDGVRLGGRFIGGTGDFREVPRSLYRPDLRDFRIPASDGAAGPLALPMTSGTVCLRHYSPLDGARRPVVTARLALQLLRARRANRSSDEPAKGYEMLAMWKDWRSPADFWDAAFAAADEVSPRHLAFAIRSDTGLPNRIARRFDAVMAHLAVEPRARDLHFMTPTRAVAELGESVSR
jgi:hypothetical protein